jgi:hypothetical protein
MEVHSHRGVEKANSADEFVDLLSLFDQCGGGEYWCSQNADDYPCLVIRFQCNWADVHWFEAEDSVHRCLRPDGADPLPGSFTKFEFEGWYEPEGQHMTPNEFVIDRETAFDIAREFFKSAILPRDVEWCRQV